MKIDGLGSVYDMLQRSKGSEADESKADLRRISAMGQKQTFAISPAAVARLSAFNSDDAPASLVIVDVQTLRAEIHCDRIIVTNNSQAAAARLLRCMADGVSNQVRVVASSTGILTFLNARPMRISSG